MALYYLSNTLHKVDFNQSTDTPYDMETHWRRRTRLHVFVRDKKRDHRPPDMVSWCGMEAAITPYESDTPLPMGYFNATVHGSIYVAINTVDGVLAIGVTSMCWPIIAQVGPDFAELRMYDLIDDSLLSTFPKHITTDWYTDELVYVRGDSIVKKKGDRIYTTNTVPIGTLEGIVSVGNVCYTINSQYFHMYDDRISEHDPLELYSEWDYKNFHATTRMISEVVMEIGYIDTTDDYNANMALFDVRSPYTFAAQMTPVPITAKYIKSMSIF
jgi:hypothetical protein